jgi:hypothetical protein
MVQHNHDLPPVRVAFVLDNKVVDVLHTDDRLAAIFLSSPVVVDITDYENTYSISVDSVYTPETGEFTPVVLPNNEGIRTEGSDDLPDLEDETSVRMPGGATYPAV